MSPSPRRGGAAPSQAALGEALLDAARREDVEEVREWLQQGASVAARGEDGETALHLAASSGSSALIGLLLERRAPLHALCARGRSALDAAVAPGGPGCRDDVAILLLERRASLGLAADNADPTPLHFAARRGLFGVVRKLIERAGPDLHSALARELAAEGPTPFSLALQWMHTDVAILLLDRRALTPAERERGPSPLHLAAALGAEEVVETLLARCDARLDAGALRELGPDGTALHVAVVAGSEAVARRLLEHRADPEVRGRRDGLTALDLAVRARHLDIAEMLLEHGAKANMLSEGASGWRPLLSAVDASSVEASEMLMDHGAHADLPSEYPLHVAARLGDAPMVALLLRRGARCDAPDASGRTPLHHAARFGRPEVVSMLLRERASPDAQDSAYGHTPLHLAAIYNTLEVAGVLLQGRADFRARCRRGLAPVEVAIKHGHHDFTQLLLQADQPGGLQEGWQRGL